MGKISMSDPMHQKDIVLVRFPFSNQIDYKIRPAIIVSNDFYNKHHSSFWIVPLTTKESLKEFEIELPNKEIVSGNINEKSFVRADNIATIEDDLILKEIGKISDRFFEKVKAAIVKNIEIKHEKS